ncbi:acetyl-CoA carboxylase biotin carboxylase subunit [Macrococcoides canis]|uniref:Biotin carboxylase n=1 Tax=Macrococcoides canis TaxID=1855823 RepID=A0A1W7AD68_9STAP|nr:acetyl-CoA carboxylase biotin carboxylase subunit [Macrococcus canis]ARQ07545.1 Biotin carboxylase [Macrococcus canis]UJS27229.1 acetyl-CoA carboxylase biotin carboxylase subunit [Macrococcus canis]UTG99534.1 acetyl-CoA carboxylase biotin carboxylase subunit [Macrococcus canis]UTH11056.1 acetyl-CoA carboxylase biotin carboxylase subunit [Macrococcus canis]
MKKVLIANRGEIAIRIIRSCKKLGIKTVAVYSNTDADSLHVALADEAICIGPASSTESYLNMNNIIAAAEITHADAIHPGYGFLAENSKFARLCAEHDIIFIGPTPETIDKMGDKAEARKTMISAGVPVIPGSKDVIPTIEEAREKAQEIGVPLVIKAVAGGGGKGMRIVSRQEDFDNLFHAAKNEAKKAFGDDRVYIEKFIRTARHIEVQVIGDGHGDAVHLYDRDCSIQRNNQKLIEEAPAVIVPDEVRTRMTTDAVNAAKNINYRGAGTLEFLYVEETQEYYFLEMNTRVQVEHTVTEMVTGVDIIEAQLKIALYDEFDLKQEEIQIMGFSMECRINAEDPQHGFRPSPGKVTALHLPAGPGVRIDTFLYPNCMVSPFYDSMIGKFITFDKTRDRAIKKMLAALDETVIAGFETNLDYQYRIVQHPRYHENLVDIKFLEKNHFLEG